MEDLDVSDKKQVSRKKKKWELQREREVDELKRLLEDDKCRWLLWRILDKCGIYQTTTNVHNPYDMAHKSGQRDLGIWLLNEIISADVDGYTKLMKTARDRENG